MTVHHPTEQTLNQLVDGNLGDDSAAAVAHVSCCPQCASYVQRIERLRRTAAAMPRAIVPPPAVWTAVQSQIDASTSAAPPAAAIEGTSPASGTPGRPPVRRFWWSALAASVVFAAGAGAFHLTSVYGRTSGTIRSGDAAMSTSAGLDSTPWSAGLVEADSAIVERLRSTLSRDRLYMPAGIATEVATRLRSLTTAMIVTQAALASDPNNVQLEAMMDRTRRQRVEYVNSTLTLLADY